MQKFIVDTNFILRYLLADNKLQYQKAKDIFDLVREGKAQVKLEQAVFVEIIFVLSSFYEVPKEKIIHIMNSFLSYKGIDTDKELLNTSLDIYGNNNIHIVDSIIIAKSRMQNLEALTFDKKILEILKK